MVCVYLVDMERSCCKRQFSLIEFEKPVYCAENSLVIGSRLDTDAYILIVVDYIAQNLP